MDILPISFGGQPDLPRAVPLVVLCVIISHSKVLTFIFQRSTLGLRHEEIHIEY